MSREDFVAIAVRLFSIYILYAFIQAVPGVVSVLSLPNEGGWLWLYVLVMALVLLFVAFLWFFPLTIARKLLPVMREPRSETALDSSTALSIGITLIGLWFLAKAIADGAYWLTLLVGVAQSDSVGFEWSHEQVAGMAATVVELVIALCLVLGSSGVKRLIHRYRYGEAPHARQ